MKISIIIPVYYNELNLVPLYEDIREKFIKKTKYEYELIFVDDGSKDKSFEVLQDLQKEDDNISIYRLSRNFGSHAAILCGLAKATGDCAIVKAADLQEPTELMLDMIESWEHGNKVVLAVRKQRNESWSNKLFANFYYWLVRKVALKEMPKGGFDVYLIDRKVIQVLLALDEVNSALTGQILWSGFKTDIIYYTRLAREVGKSRWTFKKKVRLVSNTIFSFSTLPITGVIAIGGVSFCGAIVWAIVVLIFKLNGLIDVDGWTTMFIFNLFSFGVIMMTLGIIGSYLWRTFDATRNRPAYIVEEDIVPNKDKRCQE